MSKPIFISYKRVDEERVIPIKERIEAETGAECWIDTDGIESDADFRKSIIHAIKECEVFLFMFSKSHLNVEDLYRDWTIKEIGVAEEMHKRIVILCLDDVKMPWALFMDYQSKQKILAYEEKSMLRLMKDLNKWLGSAMKDTSSDKTGHADDSSESNHSEAFEISNDISVAFIANDNLYFCFGETGQKLKIPMSSFKDGGLGLTIEGIVNKVDSLKISESNTVNKDCSVYKFCKTVPDIVRKSDRILIFYTDSVESYLNALDIQERYRGVVNTRLIAEDQIGALGVIAENADCKEAQTIEYRLRNHFTEVVVGDGIIEIGDRKKFPGYMPPSIKDIIKGSIIQFGILNGEIRNALLLATTSFDLYLVVYENGVIRKSTGLLIKGTTIPTKYFPDFAIESHQKVILQIDDVGLTTSINKFFSEITDVVCEADHDILIEGKKGNRDVCIPLSTLIKSCAK